MLCVIVLTFRTKQVYNLALGRARAGLGLECVNRKKKWTSDFIWGQMRSRAWETASQIVLRTCSEEVGRGQYIHLAKWVCAVKHTFEHKVAASHKEQINDCH